MPIGPDALRYVQGRSWTSTDLISDVRRKARLPSTSPDYTDAVICREATDAMTSVAQMPLLLAASGSGRFLDVVTYPLTTSAGASPLGYGGTWGAAGTDDQMLNSILLPKDFIAAVSVEYHSATTDKQGIPLQPLPASQRAQYMDNDTGEPRYYVLYDNFLEVVPHHSLDNAACITLTYQASLPEIVPLTECGTVDNTNPSMAIDAYADPDSATFTLPLAAAHPTTWADPNYHIDLYSPHWPGWIWKGAFITSDTGGANTELVGQVNNAYNNSTAYAFETRGRHALSGLFIGPPLDTMFSGSFPEPTYVCLSGTSPVIPLPGEFRQALTLQTAAQILRQIGDTNGANEMIGDVQRILFDLKNAFNPRHKGKSPKIVNPNSPLRLRRRNNIWGRWGDD